METIFKYELEIVNEQIVPIPSGSRPLSVQEQNGKLILWAVVDESKKSTGNFKVRIFGTGNPLPYSLMDFSYDSPSGYVKQHIGTVQMSTGFVWHVFI